MRRTRRLCVDLSTSAQLSHKFAVSGAGGVGSSSLWRAPPLYQVETRYSNYGLVLAWDGLQIISDALQIAFEGLQIRKSILECLPHLVGACRFVLRAVRDDGTSGELGATRWPIPGPLTRRSTC